MSPFLTMLLFTTATGACILAGGLLAHVERIRPLWLEREMRHSIIAFGGGVLIAAVALVLVPEGTHRLDDPWLAALAFLLGGFCFFIIERLLALHHHESPNLIAMLLDYLPESLALGGMFASRSPSAAYLALLIGLQNIPEGFNAYRELRAREQGRPGRILALMAALIPLGPVIGTIGWFQAARHEAFLGGSMLFASGGILYLVFQDIAPQSHLRRHWAPALGAVLGFVAGMLGKLLVLA